MRFRSLFFALLLVAAVHPAATTATMASPPPEPVCVVCGHGFEETADDAGVNLTVESSTVRVQIDEDGVGHWTARVTVDDESAATFRENPSLLDSIVRRTFEERWGLVDDPHDLSSRIAGDTVVVTFTVPEMASHGVGDVLLVDYFNDPTERRHVYVGADRFVVTGPEGSHLLTNPPKAATNETAATWGDSEQYESTVHSQTYLTFGPDGGLTTTAAAYASIAVDSGPNLLSDLVRVAFIPTLMLILGILFVQHFNRRFDDGRDSQARFGTVVTALGVVWSLCLVALGMFSGGTSVMAWVLGLQLMAFGLVAAKRPEVLTFRRLVAAAVVPPVVAAVAVSVVTAPSVPWNIPSALALGTAVVLFLPFGYGARRGRETRPIAFAIVLAPVTFTIPALPIGGWGPVFMAILLVVWGGLTLATGTLVYRLGWTLAGEFPETEHVGGSENAASGA
ncbi:hypothetical protein E6P09_12395 [Haloferax mediterranei ATCC 33500]|uniref:Uncharacterized protein n=1 Tax=Haloferax mediterranei (strain ATCC 33500 / DSM 1411 / JCM 8866 / NBRC 14739 / NCIMB 2177 / R-4) TaxID=523841 RepID=I3R8I8_HALMT|nr:hypothetical protein [Haloferax mediterranei]AFK20548.1 hypothetical protein HFX_2878 [Haloferax mediterranei ATCC 33500]AHZ23905.1 hypothetical protein BM92_15185 [Haloferax mediterranei ATCC 33500]ELZ98330.1 hypothetical protein C439_16135 [Haloferax mediterranei ATCC 33500]MDX5986697.1 hypothetical protein [Haloferax mediterranei ATCC 33500]QCQ76024.1 hypothetical protein E6P09_12395 [Haloferax mediterranei ATCC 33500]